MPMLAHGFYKYIIVNMAKTAVRYITIFPFSSTLWLSAHKQLNRAKQRLSNAAAAGYEKYIEYTKENVFR